MDATTVLLEILKYTIPAIIVLISSYLIVKKFLVTHIQQKQLAIFKESQDITLRLRLQAYERLTLFIERIKPRQLIPRIYTPDMTVQDLQQAIVFTINSEFEHNLSQQIYVSTNVWKTVWGVKEQEVNMTNHISKTLNPEAPALELYGRIMEMILKSDSEMPTDVALAIINEEASKVLSYSSY